MSFTLVWPDAARMQNMIHLRDVFFISGLVVALCGCGDERSTALGHPHESAGMASIGGAVEGNADGGSRLLEGGANAESAGATSAPNGTSGASTSTPAGGSAGVPSWTGGGRSGTSTDGSGGLVSGGETNAKAICQRIKVDLAQAIESSACPAVCPMTNVTARQAEPLPSSQGQRILLIDDGIIFAAATRYASRTLAFLKTGDDGSYREYAPSFEMPTEAYDILKTADGVSRYVSGSELNLVQPFADKFLSKLPDGWEGHGSDIYAFLAEKVPEAQFLVSESKLEFRAPCELLGEEAAEPAWLELTERFLAMEQSLTQIISEYGINYVHLSWGMEYDGLVNDFLRDCGGTPSRAVTDRILGLYVGLFRAITTVVTPGADGRWQPVMIFQAGASADVPEDFLLDCTGIPGRIRAYSVAYKGNAVPLGGSHEYSILTTPELSAMACNDVYLVMGYDSIFGVPRPEYFQSLSLGLGPAP
ncbi:MAG TPA: hypothetical protein VIV60_24510, partial [Polyangiaceae bacterium]